MKKSGLLQRQADSENAMMHAAERLTKQYMIDTVQLTLHELGWGFDRIMRFSEQWQAVREEYRAALWPKDPECDVAQDHMDRALVQIINGKMELIPFSERYPDLRKITYGGKR